MIEAMIARLLLGLLNKVISEVFLISLKKILKCYLNCNAILYFVKKLDFSTCPLSGEGVNHPPAKKSTFSEKN